MAKFQSASYKAFAKHAFYYRPQGRIKLEPRVLLWCMWDDSDLLGWGDFWLDLAKVLERVC
jgi:hypothetical protein